VCLTTQKGLLLTFDDQAARMDLRQCRSSEAWPFIWLFRNLIRLTAPCFTLVPTSSPKVSKNPYQGIETVATARLREAKEMDGPDRP